MSPSCTTAKAPRLGLLLMAIFGSLLVCTLISFFIYRMLVPSDHPSRRQIGKYSSCQIEYQTKKIDVGEPKADQLRTLWNRVISTGYAGTRNTTADEFNFYSGNYTTFIDASRIEWKVYWWNLQPSMAKFESNGETFYCRISQANSDELTKEFEKLIAQAKSKK